jgi:hypothetical protein
MCFNRELIARNEKLGTSILCGIGGRYIVQHYAAFDPIRQEYRATQKGCTSEIYTAISEGVCASLPERILARPHKALFRAYEMVGRHVSGLSCPLLQEGRFVPILSRCFAISC